ncbi:MAG: hypothetical protein IT304_10095 [Dehalococcoidia bacterium]|nr:hypothetical protein [Dehalococcoidia bacterium]
MNRLLAGGTLGAALAAIAYLAFDRAGSGDPAPARPAVTTLVAVAPTPSPRVSESAAVVAVAPAENTAADAHDDRPPALIPGRTAGCGLDHAPGDSVESLSGPDDRSYRLHVPPAYDGRAAFPLVLSFHGFGRSAAEQEAYSGLVPVADREGFVLVTPEGSGDPPGWDVLGVYDDDGVDDVTMTTALLGAVEGRLCLDRDRIYATGLSNGAEMASQVGCMLPDLFAAVAPVAGVVYQGCAGEGMPLVTFHGTSDFNVPFDSAPLAVEEWAAHNGCAAPPADERLSDAVERLAYSSCTAGADVVFYVIHGGGHTWPGADDDTGGVGPTTHEIRAAELIWQFFAAHPRAAAAGR